MATSPQRGVADSDILIDAVRGTRDAILLLAALRDGPGVRISVISTMELIAGCRDALELKAVQAFVRHMVVLPITPAASIRACRLMESFSLSHRLGIPDALIAATALELDLPLYTRNVKHFGMIPALSAIRPY